MVMHCDHSMVDGPVWRVAGGGLLRDWVAKRFFRGVRLNTLKGRESISLSDIESVVEIPYEPSKRLLRLGLLMGRVSSFWPDLAGDLAWGYLDRHPSQGRDFPQDSFAPARNLNALL